MLSYVQLVDLRASDVAEQGIDLQHIALLQGKFGQLIADLHIQQKLSLVFDQIQDLLHLGEDENTDIVDVSIYLYIYIYTMIYI